MSLATAVTRSALRLAIVAKSAETSVCDET